MKLSRKWLNEFVDVAQVGDRDFAEAMTLSGSKVEITEVLNESLKNVVVGKLLSLERHPDSDHMWVCQLDVGEAEPVQIVTGAWNIHVGDLVPVAKHKSLLPGGVKIEKGKLRGVASYGMLCSLKELGLTAEHDYPYAVITPAALLNDYHPLEKDKPSIPADIQPGDKVFGPVVCARVLSCETKANGYAVKLETGSGEAETETPCANLHEGDLVAFNTKTNTVCTLSDLHAQQAEFPHCIPDGIFVLHEDGAKPGDDIAAVLGLDDHVVEFEITPNRPDCLSVIGLAREASATFGKPLQLHTPEIRGCGGSIADSVDIDIEDADLCPRYTARLVKNVRIQPSPAWMRERLRNSGVRPINNIVDITNYVMLEYGQPMHAFDFSCVEGGHIIVRTAREGETIQTLDGNQRKLTPSMLCICDEEKPVCVAGVMGGANSEIVGDTAMVLFESANFNGASVRRTAAALNMRTDASARYEGSGPEHHEGRSACLRAASGGRGGGRRGGGHRQGFRPRHREAGAREGQRPPGYRRPRGRDAPHPPLPGLRPGGGHHPGPLLALRRGALLRHCGGSGPLPRLQRHPGYPGHRPHPAPGLQPHPEGREPGRRSLPLRRVQ